MDTRLGPSIEYSHFNTLPTEIVSQIFRLCPPTFSPSLLPTAPSRSQHTFRVFDLGAVCARWRSIVWDMPSLWTSIIVYATSSNINTQIDRLAGQLARCGDTLPLDIAISCADGEDWSLTRKPPALLQPLVPYVGRWRSLLLQIPHISPLALPGPQISLPLLTTLLIDDKSVDCPKNTFLRGATNLDNLILFNSLHITLLDIPDAYRVLTSVTLHKCYVTVCIYTFHKFRFIRHATFKQLDRGVARTSIPLNLPIHDLPLHLPHLDSLQLIKVQNSISADALMGSISAPALTHFLYDSWYPLDLTTFRELVFPESSLLTSLSLSDLRAETHSKFIQIMRLCTNISTLELVAPIDNVSSVTCLSDAFFDLFNPSVAGPTSILPNLETLKYSGRQAFRWPNFIAAWDERGKNRPRVSDKTRYAYWKEWDIQLRNWDPILQETIAQLGRKHDAILRVSNLLS